MSIKKNTQENIFNIRSQEINYWKYSSDEGPGQLSLEKMIEKLKNADFFISSLKHIISNSGCNLNRVIEIGGGQGWASCIVKRIFPNAEVTHTDISPFAVESLPIWEKILSIKVDKSFACEAHNTKEDDESYDMVFSFSAAHHFINQSEALTEFNRILKPGGLIVYFFEPICNNFFYPFAYRRVNKIRTEVHEDLLIISQLRLNAKKLNLNFNIINTPYYWNRKSLTATIYYICLYIFRPLKLIFPHTGIVIYKKNDKS